MAFQIKKSEISSKRKLKKVRFAFQINLLNPLTNSDHNFKIKSRCLIKND